MFDPVTIILVLLLVLVTILYFTKKPKDQFKLSPNFKEVSLPLSSPDGKLKLQYKEDTVDGIKFTLPFFVYENKSAIYDITKDLFIGGIDYGEEVYNAFGITNYSVKFYEYYNDNTYQIVVIVNEIFIINKTIPISTTTKPKISLSDDKKFVISNITFPGSPNEAKFDIFGI